VRTIGQFAKFDGQGNSYEEALANAKSAASFHIETFGSEAVDDDSDV
jgi:predicted RNase H-like HicB family nuclease